MRAGVRFSLPRGAVEEIGNDRTMIRWHRLNLPRFNAPNRELGRKLLAKLLIPLLPEFAGENITIASETNNRGRRCLYDALRGEQRCITVTRSESAFGKWLTCSSSTPVPVVKK